jgi:hypothetical protein
VTYATIRHGRHPATTDKGDQINMWSTDTLKKYTGVNIESATAAQMTDAYVKQVATGTRAEIAAAILAHYMERRGFTFEEASTRTGRSASSMKRDAARATVLLELPEAHAAVAWSHLAGMKDSDARALGEALALVPEVERLASFIEGAAARVIEERCPSWTAEQKQNAAAHVVGRGPATKDRMRDSVLAYADTYGLTLPIKQRSAQEPDGAKVPTLAAVANLAAMFEKDREQGSEGVEFEVSDAEAAEAVRAIETLTRVLRRSQRVEELETVAEFYAESLALLS